MNFTQAGFEPGGLGSCTVCPRRGQAAQIFFCSSDQDNLPPVALDVSSDSGSLLFPVDM